MAEDTGAEGTQAEPTTQPQAGATQQAQAASAEPETISLEAARKLRSENQSLRERLKAIEDKDLPEAERTKRERDEAVRERDAARVEVRKRDVMLEAAALGFSNPRLAYAAVVEMGLLELDRDGYPTNTEAALKKLLRDNPNLASTTARASGSAEGGVRGTGKAGTTDMNAMIRQAAGRG